MNKYILQLILLISSALISCQSLTDFNPPDFEEKLCINAVINNGKEKNKIIIEKTHQYEYPSDVTSSLEDLTVIIKSETEIVFETVRPRSENRIDTVFLPADLGFTPDEKYTLIISEKNSQSISSEITMPDSPIMPEISISGSAQTFLAPPLECHNPVGAIVLNVTFISDPDRYYYLDIDGSRRATYNDTLKYLIDYDIIESNSPYFRSSIFGLMSFGFMHCWADWAFITSHNYEPCFFDSETIPENTCEIKISININKENYNYNKPIRISLNSIPKDLFSYEKSYHTYLETLLDPFSEPVYISGNIKGGYGIFAICSGSQTSLIIPADILNSKQ